MLANLFGLFGRRPKVRNPRLVFEMLADGRVQVLADWPDASTTKEKLDIGQRLAYMAHYLNSGQLLALMQNAIAVCGQVKGQQKISEATLNLLNQTRYASDGGHGECVEETGPLVSPDRVFTKD